MGRYTGQTCRLIFMLVLTAAFFVAELVSGYVGNSLALVSDSFSMLSDLVALCVGITSRRLARRPRPRGPRRRGGGGGGGGAGAPAAATFGLSRAEVVGALSNAVFLAGLYFTMLVEAVQRLAQPEGIRDPFLILVVGALGLAVNLVGLGIFQDWPCCGRTRSRTPEEESADAPSAEEPVQAAAQVEERSARTDGHLQLEGVVVAEAQGGGDEAGDSINTQKKTENEEVVKKEKKSEALNIRGVLLHVLGDALGSVVVVVAASIFYALPLKENEPCNWECYIDPSLTIIMVIIILSSAIPLIKETATILLQMVPKSVNMQILTNKLLEVPGVSSIHEVHVWELVQGKNIATLHIKCNSTYDYEKASYKMREVFHEAGVHSVTIQPEYMDHRDQDILCNTQCISPACNPHLCCMQQEAFLAQVNGYNGKGGLSPTLQKSFKKIDMIAIPAEPTWVEDVVKKDGSPKGNSKESSQPQLVIRTNTRF